MAKTKKTKRHQFTVDRAKWVNGSNSHSDENISLLRNEQGNMCCVGFLAKSCGLTDRTINGEGALEGLSGNAWRGRIELFNAIENSSIYSVNDSTFFDSKSREKKLTKLFREIGVDVKFVGRAPRTTQ